jgi:SAM-dependent methyltransferase
MTSSSHPPCPVPPSAPAGRALPPMQIEIERLARRIAAVTEVEVAEALRRLRHEHEDVGSNVREDLARRRIVPHVWSDALAHFYETTDAFFYELVVWNRSTEKTRQREWILDRFRRRFPHVRTVLMYGDGLGFDGVFLRRAGYTVTCFEVSPLYREFAEHVFADAGVSVEWIDREELLQGRTFDAIVCLDVLEHVPDPPQLTARLVDLLAPEGMLVVHAPFWHVTADSQTHLRTNRRYSGDICHLYSSVGLVPVDAHWMWNPIVLARAQAARHTRDWLGSSRVMVGRLILLLARWIPLPFDMVGRWMLQRDAIRCFADRGNSFSGAERAVQGEMPW